MTDPLAQVPAEAAACTRCDLYQRATPTVFGEGPVPAVLALVGEQPGDYEDRQGHPFVGPSGELLDRALLAAGIDRSQVYVTNAVKHFKWMPRGKRRIHQAPNQTEIQACRPWLEQELLLAAPDIAGLLGAVAAKALLARSSGSPAHGARCWPPRRAAGRDGRWPPFTRRRSFGPLTPRRGEQAFEAFVADLAVMAGLLVR